MIVPAHVIEPHMIVVDFTPEKKADSRQHRPVNFCEGHTFNKEVEYVHCDALSLGMHLEVGQHAIDEMETLNDHLGLTLL